MIKKLITLFFIFSFFITSVFALTPDTISMYDKISNVELIDVSEGGMSGLYIVFAVIVVAMILFYLYERRNIRAAKKAEGKDIFRNK